MSTGPASRVGRGRGCGRRGGGRPGAGPGCPSGLASRVQAASQTAYVDGTGAENVPVVGVDGLLAVLVVVRRLREALAGADPGGGRCPQMLRCPPEPGSTGERAAVAGL